MSSGNLLKRLEQARSVKASNLSLKKAADEVQTVYYDEYASFKNKVHKEILDQMNFGNIVNIKDKEEIHNLIKNIVDEFGTDISRPIKNKLISEIQDETLGLGPLETLLKDETITEIMVNGPYKVYVERNGKIELSSIQFRDNNHVLNIIDRIVSPLGRRCDESTPMVDARLADGSRVNAIIPPISLIGPSITIRKFSKRPLEIADLIKNNSLSYQMSSFLEACVKGKANMIVFGGTGSGKTTLLNTLSGFIPENERIVTIEDAAELQLKQPHTITLESRPANVEGAGSITIRDLVRNSLRMRPDRIVVGEVRSGEALDMLQAMNTGHDGSLTTAHANTTRDLLSRLETMVLMAGMGLPSHAIREQIASAFNIVVHQSRLRDGSRKIMAISEILGMESDTIVLQDIFVFKQDGFDSSGNIRGTFVPTGIRPKILQRLSTEGVMINDSWFNVNA
ncbi:MAG: CpaF family protein [Peptoniphilaceae bacterium]|uniref:CpaF family protein n=1 Tax=Parvimonas sp. TaxID=1944660 RepID=UPI0025E42FC5|nr:CpaF family protein [Parvimonas sp.]MCI5997612.1 CpaF family protein [Parvimonas sp.]MDD7765207.1 CpaF family protein [Peptoniphilaceae bacterium]MDY3051418.1 CpaF family protein [Parvimonas sp.]